MSHVPIHRLLAGELWTGTIIGLCLGALTFPAVYLTFQDAHLALAVASAITCAGMVATSVGFLFPWLLAGRGKDPAPGAGPVATIIQDVLSLLIYFTIVQFMVH